MKLVCFVFAECLIGRSILARSSVGSNSAVSVHARVAQTRNFSLGRCSFFLVFGLIGYFSVCVVVDISQIYLDW
jgi:uncharacterized membrane protein YczE